jgi:hypothetical protein
MLKQWCYYISPIYEEGVFIDLHTIESIVGKLLDEFDEVDDNDTLMLHHPIASLYYDIDCEGTPSTRILSEAQICVAPNAPTRPRIHTRVMHNATILRENAETTNLAEEPKTNPEEPTSSTAPPQKFHIVPATHKLYISKIPVRR